MADSSKPDPANTKLQAPADLKGVVDKRGCTDVLFLLLLLIAWGAMTFLGLVVLGVIPSPYLPKGDPQRLLAPVDSFGRLCGVDADVKDRPSGYLLSQASFICVDSCPEATDVTQFYCQTKGADYKKALSPSAISQALSNNTCMFQIKTKKVLNYCIPYDDSFKAAFAAQYGGSFNGTMTGTPSKFLTNLVADLYASMKIILGFGIGVAVVLGFVYLLLLQIPGLLCLLIWAILFAILGIFVGIGLFTIYTSKQWTSEVPRTHSSKEIKAITIFGYVAYGLAGLWFCFILAMAKRINLALAVIKEASRAVGSMKMLILYPIFQTIGLGIFLVPWIIYSLYLMSSGSYRLISGEVNYHGVTYPYSYKEFEYTKDQRYAQIYMLFIYFWTSEFIVALGQLVVALSVATWYFTRDKSTVGSGAVCGAIRRASFYHAGTAAFGSLVIAIIKTISAIIAYFQKKAAQSKNRILTMLLCMLQCCMWCLEKCMKFLNKNAYIITAVFGYSFCHAAKTAFFLILRNIARIAAVTIVGEFVLLLGKLLIPAATTFGAYIVIQFTIGDQLSGVVGPLVCVAILAFSTATLFNEVYGMAISSIFICFLADEDMYPDNPYADGSLRDTIAHINQKAALHTGQVSPEKQNPALV